MTEPARSAARTTVMIVDDNMVIRQIYRKALEGAGFTVTEADGGARAQQLVNQAMPALIVLDLMMVSGDGFSFLEHLRRRTDGAEVPVVVVTAKPLSESEERVLAALTQGTVRKSKNTAADILAKVREFVSPPAAT